MSKDNLSKQLADAEKQISALLTLNLTDEEIEALKADDRCGCGHLMVFHHYNGGLELCWICECET